MLKARYGHEMASKDSTAHKAMGRSKQRGTERYARVTIVEQEQHEL